MKFQAPLVKSGTIFEMTLANQPIGIWGFAKGLATPTNLDIEIWPTLFYRLDDHCEFCV